MKRAFSLILALVICLTLCACNRNNSEMPKWKSFNSAEELLNSISGMWLVDSNKKEYIVSHDGKIYHTNELDYKTAVNQFLQDIFLTKGLEAWKNMDYQSAIEEMNQRDLLLEPLTDISIHPETGTIVLYKGWSGEMELIVTDSGPVLMQDGIENIIVKIADAPPYFADTFETLFNEIKSNFTAPKSAFIPTAKAYGDLLQSAHGQVQLWPVVSNSNGSLIKTLDGTLTGNYGAYILTESMVTLCLGQKEDNEHPYTVMYHTVGEGVTLLIRDRWGSSLEPILSFVTPVVQNIPNSLTGKQLYDMYIQERELSGNVYLFNKTIGSITYQIYQGNKWPDLYSTIMVSVADTIPLADVLNDDSTLPDSPDSPPSDNNQPNQGNAPEHPDLNQLLIPSRIWRISWADDYGVTWACEYVFDGEGNFKMLLADGMSYVARYQGTYLIAENTISIFNELPDGTQQYVYDYHPESGIWEQKSVIGYAYDHEKGDKFVLHENKDYTTERFLELFDMLGRTSEPDLNADEPPAAEPTYKPDAPIETTPEKPLPTNPQLCNHQYAPATCSNPQTCIICGVTTGNPTNHTWKEATCTTARTCAICETTIGDPLGHEWKESTCTTPQACTTCGTTLGNATGHIWEIATCVQPRTCTICGETAGGLANHVWKEATCTEPETCTVCKKTSGKAKSHNMLYTKCQHCDYSDFNCIAKNYTDISCFDGKTGADYEVENVSISSSGVLSFTFNGVTHSIVLIQSGGDVWSVTFDCYENGTLIQDAQVRANESSKGILVHLTWKHLDGCYLYFCLFG